MLCEIVDLQESAHAAAAVLGAKWQATKCPRALASSAGATIRHRSVASAQRMFDAYRHVLKGKWKTLLPKQESPGLLVGEGDDGYFRVQLAGTRLTSIEGMKTLSGVTDIR